MHALRIAVLAAFVFVLAACGPERNLVTARQGYVVYDIQLDTSMDWSRAKGQRVEMWTIDGIPLNRFLVIARIKPNEHVYLSSKETKSRPDGTWFRPGMRPDEIRDVMVDALISGGWTRVSTSNLRPAKFGTVDGLRFEITMTSDSGLIYKGMVGAAEHQGKLTHFSWTAPAEYYYDRDRVAVDKMFSTIRFIN